MRATYVKNMDLISRAAIEKFNAKMDAIEAERDKLREEVDRLHAQVGAVIRLLGNNGCDCDCDHDNESHDPDCERCLACRVELALKGGK